MKKIVITGAAGTLGKKVLKYLLIEGKYDITAVDLKTRHNKKSLKKYKKRIKIIYDDITNSEAFENSLKDASCVIHLAGVMPPLADLNDTLAYNVDYKCTETIVRVLDFYNPKCHLLFASTASVYGKQESDTVSVNTKVNIESLGSFSTSKYNSENLIKDKLSNYTIYRIPIVLTNPVEENYIYLYKNNSEFEIITDEDAGYMFSKSIDHLDEINKKTYNVGGGEVCYTTGNKLNNYILKNFGLTSKYVKTKLFIDKNFYSYKFKDSNKLDEILSFRNDSIDSYFLRSKRKSKNYYLRKLIGKLFIKKNK